MNRLQDELILSFSYRNMETRHHALFISYLSELDQEMTISYKGRESNDSKIHRMCNRIILLNQIMYFFYKDIL